MADAPISYQGDLFSGDKVTPAIQKALEVARAYGLALTKARTPVDTGQLKAFWNASLSGNGIRWENPTSYASFVELGTKHMAGRYMLTDSLPEILEVFKDELYRQIGSSMGSQVLSEVTNPSYETAQNRTKKNTLPGGRAFESPLIAALSEFGRRGQQLPQRKDLLTPSQRKRVANARPRFQKKPFKRENWG